MSNLIYITFYKGLKPVKCYTCKITFASRQEMNEHIILIHKGYKLTDENRLIIERLLTSK